MKRFAVIYALFFLTCVPAFAEPPSLERADAKRILEAMNWKEVTVVSVRQGVDAKGAVAPIYATVIGLGKFNGEHHSILQTLYFDRELDWHVLELGEKGARVWNKGGCREIVPWGTW